MTDNIIEMINDIEKRELHSFESAQVDLVKANCTTCRYAKVCNHKKGVEGLQIQRIEELFYPSKEAYINSIHKTILSFKCSKRKPRKSKILFEETKIYRTATFGKNGMKDCLDCKHIYFNSFDEACCGLTNCLCPSKSVWEDGKLEDEYNPACEKFEEEKR